MECICGYDVASKVVCDVTNCRADGTCKADGLRYVLYVIRFGNITCIRFGS